MKVDPNDPQSVAWLQQALTKLVPRVKFAIGSYDLLTDKNVRRYQEIKGIPQTGVADEFTTNLIEQDLAQLP